MVEPHRLDPIASPPPTSRFSEGLSDDLDLIAHIVRGLVDHVARKPDLAEKRPRIEDLPEATSPGEARAPASPASAVLPPSPAPTPPFELRAERTDAIAAPVVVAPEASATPPPTTRAPLGAALVADDTA